MTQRIARFLAPIALFEWGAILIYFYCSHRLAGLLHPNFRPPVLVTGFLLMFAAACLLFSTEEPDAQNCDCESCDHSHAKLTLGGLLGFLVLLLPVLLAAKVSPDSYGAVLVQNRGVAESLENVPGALSHTQRPLASAVYAGSDMPSEPSPPDAKDMVADIPKGWIPPNAPEFSSSKNVPDPEYPSNKELTEMLRWEKSRKAPLMALNEKSVTDSNFGSIDELLDKADSPLHEGGAGALKTTDDGTCLAVEVVDLLIAAQNPTLLKQLNGKRIELTGQVLSSDGGNFRLLRLLVLCCAADAQPLAVRVETHGKPKPTQMTWVKVAGKVTFAKKGKSVIPVIAAEKVTPVPEPEEPFLY